MQTALVIEDNANNMELISFILQASGYKVLCAMKGAQGIEMFDKENADFVLLDIQLPDIDGIEVLRRLRATDKGENTPIIAVTSYAMTGDSKKLIEAGCDGYIEKPIDPDRFINEITSMTRRTVIA